MDLNRDAMLVGLQHHRLVRPAATTARRATMSPPTTTPRPAPGATTSACFPKAAFAALTATMSDARTKHYENRRCPGTTRARGCSPSPTTRTTPELMNALRERVVRQRARFIEDYDDYVDQARLDLGKLFRIDDYPSKEALQGKFAIRYRITPVPDADHFIAKLASDDTDRVKRDIERHIEEQLHDAVGDLYRRPRRGGRAGLRPVAGGRERQTAWCFATR